MTNKESSDIKKIPSRADFTLSRELGIIFYSRIFYPKILSYRVNNLAETGLLYEVKQLIRSDIFVGKARVSAVAVFFDLFCNILDIGGASAYRSEHGEVYLILHVIVGLLGRLVVMSWRESEFRCTV